MSKIRDSARGENCTVRMPGVCNFDNSTTVFAHMGGAGMGMKSNDLHGAYTCSACHDVIDGRVPSKRFTKHDIRGMFYEAIFRTQTILLEKGLILTR